MLISNLFLCKKAILTKKFFPFLISYLAFNCAFSQVPNIAYQTPQVYTTNATISPLIVNNTGGAIPPNIYGDVSTFAGSGQNSFLNGISTTASFSGPVFLTFDPQGNLYVADPGNNAVRKITPNATVSTFAGTGASGKQNGSANTATFNYSVGVAADALGNIFVADQNNNLIRKITPTGMVSTFAGNDATGKNNGAGTSASFNSPYGMAFDSKGNLYIADEGNNIIRKVTPVGIVSTFAGSGAQGKQDGTGTAASFYSPVDVTIDSKDNLYVDDHGHSIICKITPGDAIATYAGGGLDDTDNATLSTIYFTGGSRS
ncbi:alkaline phosphatase PhoX [Mucilaginibacter sp.]|uniref:alkaline phosphatase PhoX n=1 Tax=Mucilaginibacter sp. TaxID=1882438 RepID=UPI003D146E1B